MTTSESDLDREAVRERAEKERAYYRDDLTAYRIAGQALVESARQKLALLDALEAAEVEIEKLRIPRGGYEEMAAKMARSIEECAGENRELRASLEAVEAEVGRYRTALEAVEPMLSLLRHRGMGHNPSAWNSIGLPGQHEVDAAIGKARKALGW